LLNDDLTALQANDEIRSESWLRGLGSGAFVLEGCELTNLSGTTYNMSAGIVFINGKIADIDEVLNLDLAAPQYIVLLQDVEDDTRLYEDGQSKVAASSRKAVVDTVVLGEGITLEHGQQPTDLRKVLDNVSMPVGAIIMTDNTLDFNTVTGLGSGAWANWALCDGQNGTPNLKGRFVVGFDSGQVDYNATGKTGGASSVTLTINQIPTHKHKLVADGNAGESALTSANQIAETGQVGSNVNFEYTLAGSGSPATIGSSGSEGGGQSHENRPLYYTLAYVKKIG
jgi:microcystin-dependent protein